jgi:hypothetical protein
VSFLLASLLLLFGQAAAAPKPQAPTNATPANATPAAPAPSTDPAASNFTAPAGLLLVTIKPTATADYELAIRTLQEALARDTDPTRVAVAKGWRVFKAAEPDAKANAVYVHLLMPTVPGFDYRPSLLLDALVKELAPDLLAKYQDAFAAPPTKLNLADFANMSVQPVPEPPKKPGQ